MSGREKKLIGYSVILGLLFLLCGLCLTSVRKVRNGHNSTFAETENQIKQILKAMHSYLDANQQFPPAVVRDKQGKPLYGWRVLLLPYLEHGNLYKEFKLDEAWDSPDNIKLLEKMPSIYVPRWNGAKPGFTYFQVFVGPGTAFEKDGLKQSDFPDGLGNTLFICEGRRPVPWTKPVEIDYQPNRPKPLLRSDRKKYTYFLDYPVSSTPRCIAGFGNGEVRCLPHPIDEKFLRAVISRNGGEKIKW